MPPNPGAFVTGNKACEFGLGQPLRDGAFQRALAAQGRALAGDDQNMPLAACMGARQKCEQHAMRLVERHAMQVDAPVDRQATLGDLAVHRLVDTGLV
jgi:hypothetical protein